VSAATPTGVLLVQLGTPEAPEPGPVRRYLREFLGDRRVLDIPALPRRLLLELAILPRRPRASAAAYRKIWTPEGSRSSSTAARCAALARELGPGYAVELGMRYGEPALGDALGRLRGAGAERLLVAPLFPQYAASSTGSALARVAELAAAGWDVPQLEFLRPSSTSRRSSRPGPRWRAGPRGLPTRSRAALLPRPSRAPDPQERSDPRPLPLAPGLLRRAGRRPAPLLPRAVPDARLAACLGLARELVLRVPVARLGHALVGPTPISGSGWPRREAPRRALPSFVADCLERSRRSASRPRQWRGWVATTLLVPCLNAHPAWVAALAERVRRRAASSAGLPGAQRGKAAAGALAPRRTRAAG
jgi:ferrochelatase